MENGKPKWQRAVAVVAHGRSIRPNEEACQIGPFASLRSAEEEAPHTPAVFVNKGLRAYGSWKSVRNFGE
jgi:hypothetical protein